MNAKSTKKIYNEESKNSDLEEFKIHLEEITNSICDPRSKDNQKYSLFTLIAIIFAL